MNELVKQEKFTRSSAGDEAGSPLKNAEERLCLEARRPVSKSVPNEKDQGVNEGSNSKTGELHGYIREKSRKENLEEVVTIQHEGFRRKAMFRCSDSWA